MQAIQTKFVAPTGAKGSRIKARAEAGSVAVEWDYELNTEANHQAAAQALCEKLGWAIGEGLRGNLASGQLPDGSYAHVFTN